MPTSVTGIRFVAPFVVALVFLLARAPFASGADWYVDASYSNCKGSTGSSSAPFCTIAAAIAAASSGDTIHIAPGTYVEKLAVDRSLTFTGTAGAATTIVSGGNGFTIFGIAAGVTVDLNGLSIVDGGDHSIAAVNVDVGATVSIEDCSLVGSTSFLEGAALYVNQATVTIQRCTFASNMVWGKGGAIGISGGTVTILDSDFHDNIAKGFRSFEAGGAIDIVDGTGANVDLERTTFTNNQSFDLDLNVIAAIGGAISGSGFTATDCDFSGNFAANGTGGAISGSLVTLTRCTFESNYAANAGAVSGGGLTVIGCTFESNYADGRMYVGGVGGAISGGATCEDCLFVSNVVYGGGSGGAASLGGSKQYPSSLTRCRVAGNLSWNAGYSGGSPLGGGLSLSDECWLVDCEIVGNEARSSNSTYAGIGGGIESVISTGFTQTLTRCTVGGNTCTAQGTSPSFGGFGGGIDVHGAACTLDHSIVAGNSTVLSTGAQDIRGTVDSLGWNDFGDTNGTNVTGPGTNDLLDVNPLYADPGNGDFSLSPASPCIDSGDPSLSPGGADVAKFPRFLDGNLDRVQVVDRGAHEFSNVTLSLTGTLTPGGVATLATTGTAGLPVLVVLGAASGDLSVRPFGVLFVDLTSPFVVFDFGTIPGSQTFNISPTLPVPLTIDLQALAVSGSAGNLGNLVEATIE